MLESRRTATSTALLLPFVLVSFAANSLVTRHVVADGLLDAGLLSAVRFVAGVLALLALCAARRERPVVGRTARGASSPARQPSSRSHPAASVAQ